MDPPKRIVTARLPQWSEDGTTVYVGIAEWLKKPDSRKSDDDPSTVERDEVAGEGHVTGGAGVGGVGVVEQRGVPEGGEEEDEPETAQDEQGGGATGRRCVPCCGEFGGCFVEEGLIHHESLCSFSINGLRGGSRKGRKGLGRRGCNLLEAGYFLRQR